MCPGEMIQKSLKNRKAREKFMISKPAENAYFNPPPQVRAWGWRQTVSSAFSVGYSFAGKETASGDISEIT